jgi:hypothetical protein
MTTTKTDRDYAWCPELDRVVSVREVWEFAFDKDKRINKPLTFFCPIEGCKAKVTVRGYNSARIGHLGFRLYPRDKHVHPPKRKWSGRTEE